MKLLCRVASTLALIACSENVAAPIKATPANAVLVAVDVNGLCLSGGCDPPSGELHTRTLVRIVNTGPSTAYLRACGSGLAIGEQQFVNGQWVNVSPAIACAITPGPITLAAGDSLRFNAYFASGRRRLVLAVGSSASMSDAAPASSASFDIP